MDITFDGYDRESGATIENINLWYDYEDRGKKDPKTKKAIVATVAHGSKGELVERDGKGCKVRVRKGRRLVEGWLTFYFIQELK